MEPDSGNVASYPLLKPLKPMECLQRPSGIGGELDAFPCTMLMAVGSCCFHRPVSTLITSINVSFNRHANHAEGVQYAITSLSKGTAKSCRNRSTVHFPPESRSSRLRAGLCLGRPGARFLGGGVGGLAWYPSVRISS